MAKKPDAYPGVHILDVTDLGDGRVLITGTIDGITEPVYEEGTSTASRSVKRLYTVGDDGEKVYLTDEYLASLPEARRHTLSVDGEDSVLTEIEVPVKVLAPADRWPLKTLATVCSLATLDEGLEQHTWPNADDLPDEDKWQADPNLNPKRHELAGEDRLTAAKRILRAAYPVQPQAKALGIRG